jgi:hypothetical protein
LLELLPSRTLQTTNVGEDVGKKELSHTCWLECKLVQPLWKIIWKLASPLLMNDLRKCGTCTQWNFIQPQRKMKFCHLQVSE